MATGTGNLPNQNMDFVPLATLPAADLDKLVDNIESLATGTGLGDGSIPTVALEDGAVTTSKALLNIINSNFTVQGSRFSTTSVSFVDVPGCSMTYTAGSTNELLILTLTAMANKVTPGRTELTLGYDTTDMQPVIYIENTTFMNSSRNYVVPVSAGATVTLKVRARIDIGAAGQVTNDNADWMPKITGIAVATT